MTQIITVANRKGGVAKTTTAISLGHGLALKGKTVLLMDVDPQGHLAPALGLEQTPGLYDLLANQVSLRTVMREARPNLWLVPGNSRTTTAQAILTTQGTGDDAIKKAILGRADLALDYAILDTAPSVSRLQLMALWAAGLVIIPSACDFLASTGLADLVASLDGLKRRGWSGSVLGILPTFYDQVTRESRANLDELRATFGELVLAPVHRATVFRECSAEGVTVFEKAPSSRAAQEYESLVRRVLDA